MRSSNEYSDFPMPRISGWFGLIFVIATAALAAFALSSSMPVFAGSCILIALISLNGFFILQPNQGAVATFFGEYSGSALEAGFFFSNPFYSLRKVSLKTDNYNSQSLKVNDKRGNPIEIGAVVSWRVSDAAQATLMVEDYAAFLVNQSESAIREVATQYAYDHIEPDSREKTLRGDIAEISAILRRSIQEHASHAGIEILEAKIIHLAYAPEIAHAMLRRQQAEAVVSARQKIVEGAVKMTDHAIRDLQELGVVNMDQDTRSALAVNLMTVLVGDSEASPVIPLSAPSATGRKSHGKTE